MDFEDLKEIWESPTDNFFTRDVKAWYKERFMYPNQRGKRGFSDQDLWNLGDFYVEVILESLKEFIKKVDGYPVTMESHEQWINTLQEIVKGLELKKRWDQDFLKEMSQEFQEEFLEHGRLHRETNVKAFLTKTHIPTGFWTNKRLEEFKIREQQVRKGFRKAMEQLVEHWDALWS